MTDRDPIPIIALLIAIIAGVVATFSLFSTRRSSFAACRMFATNQESGWAGRLALLHELQPTITDFMLRNVRPTDPTRADFGVTPAGNPQAMASMLELIRFIVEVDRDNIGSHFMSSHIQRWEDYPRTNNILRLIYEHAVYQTSTTSTGASVAPEEHAEQNLRLRLVKNCFERVLRSSTLDTQVRDVSVHRVLMACITV